MSLIKKILSSLKNTHIQSLLGNGVMGIFGVVVLGVLYRALSVQEIGIYVFFMTMWGLIDTLRSGFLTISFVKFYAGTDKERGNEVSGSAWGLALAVTAASIVLNILTFLITPYITNDGMILFLKYFSIVSIVSLPQFMATLVLQGDSRFDKLLWLRLINQIPFTAIVIVLSMLGKSSLTTIVMTYVVSNLIASLAALILGWTKFNTIKFCTKATFMEIFHFGKYSMGTTVSSNLFRVTDIFFINFYLGPAALAVYNLGGRLMQIIEIPLISLVASGMPSLSSHYNNNNKEGMMNVMKKMIGMLSFAIFVIAALSIVFAEPIIMIIGGEKYVDTAAPNIFRIFMSIAILYPADRFLSITLDVIHKPKVNFYKILIMLAANVIADFIGLTLFKSVYAVAVANVIPVLIAIIISYRPINEYSKFNFWHMYTGGYRDVMLLLKEMWSSVTGKEKA
ncbi:lipopolysaccharide biosynthesis protein [Pedobacter sp. AW31-3R]|uniref:lipopolysaccharide biosynthesis protein n=1 Tax=Pedobacter sp. AW31-3R TaxID=3445781 RepID=UPI003FA05DE3